MLKKTIIGLPLLTLMLFAQSPEELKFYKLEFVLKEVEGAKVLNSRSYSMSISNETKVPSSSIRTGSRVPVQITPTNMNMADVGVNIDCRFVKELQHGLVLGVTADISSVPPEATTATFQSVRQNKWSSTVVVPIKKPTVIFAADDTTSKRQMQLELIVTPIT